MIRVPWLCIPRIPWMSLVAIWMLIWLKYGDTKAKEILKMSDVHNDNIDKTKGSENTNRRKILLWDTFWGDATWEVGLGSDPFTRLDCPVKNCLLTSSKEDLNKSDAIVFHVQELNYPPPHKVDGQRWVFFMLESPGWSQNRKHEEPEWRDRFDWTMTYRQDSDIRLHYGLAKKKKKTYHEGGADIKHAAAPEPDFSQREPKKLVAWIASNCWVKSRRDDYIARLEQFIHIDKYGRCGDLTCPKDWTQQDQSCLQMLDKNYKFYLAFENSFCKDYVTEKFFKVLPLDVVPVVRGGAEYSDFVPHHWYIDARDFPTPKDLANHLLMLDKNETRYRSYFKHRKEYMSNGFFGIRDLPGWCDLCEKLNQPDDKSYYPDIRKWWNDANCHEPIDL